MAVEKQPGRHEKVWKRRLREWAYLTTHEWAGWGVCPKCSEFAYLAGKSYDGKRCKRCHMEAR